MLDTHSQSRCPRDVTTARANRDMRQANAADAEENESTITSAPAPSVTFFLDTCITEHNERFIDGL